MINPETAKVTLIDSKKEVTEDSEIRRVREILFGKQREHLEAAITQSIEQNRQARDALRGEILKMISELQNDKLDRAELASMFVNVANLLNREHGKRSMG